MGSLSHLFFSAYSRAYIPPTPSHFLTCSKVRIEEKYTDPLKQTILYLLHSEAGNCKDHIPLVCTKYIYGKSFYIPLLSIFSEMNYFF